MISNPKFYFRKKALKEEGRLNVNDESPWFWVRYWYQSLFFESHYPLYFWRIILFNFIYFKYFLGCPQDLLMNPKKVSIELPKFIFFQKRELAIDWTLKNISQGQESWTLSYLDNSWWKSSFLSFCCQFSFDYMIWRNKIFCWNCSRR